MNKSVVTLLLGCFNWDAAKSRRNRAKHGVSFEDAVQVFGDPCALMLQDRAIDGAARWQAVGRVDSHRVLVVAHAVRNLGTDDLIRIISARRALRHERKRYEDQACQDAPAPRSW